MKINRISGYIGAALMAVSCHTTPNKKPAINYVERAYNHATQYMKPEEIKIMKANANKQPSDISEEVSHKIYYWDSVLTSKKAKDAYIEGKQYAIDSINGIHYPQREFNLPLDTILLKPRRGQEIADSSQMGLIDYVGGEEMYKLVQKEIKLPDNKPLPPRINHSKNNHTTHYYGVVGSVAQERAAYNQGKNAIIKAHNNIKNGNYIEVTTK